MMGSWDSSAWMGPQEEPAWSQTQVAYGLIQSDLENSWGWWETVQPLLRASFNPWPSLWRKTLSSLNISCSNLCTLPLVCLPCPTVKSLVCLPTISLQVLGDCCLFYLQPFQPQPGQGHLPLSLLTGALASSHHDSLVLSSHLSIDVCLVLDNQTWAQWSKMWLKEGWVGGDSPLVCRLCWCSPVGCWCSLLPGHCRLLLTLLSTREIQTNKQK